MSANLNKMTKAQLVELCLAQAAELAQLRADLSAAKVTQQAASRSDTKEHSYTSFAEATENAKRLTALMGDRFTFSVVGTKVICRHRSGCHSVSRVKTVA